jgi:hypothetical protein
MIAKQAFGRTGHASTRVVFGAWALREATQAEADRVLELLLEHGVNHIDTAHMYGNAEERIGPWLEKHRAHFFIATKTRSRRRRGAWDDLRRSLDRLRVDCVDLWQMHGLTGLTGWEQAMGPGVPGSLLDHRRGHAASSQDTGCRRSLRGAAIGCANGRPSRTVWHPNDLGLSVHSLKNETRKLCLLVASDISFTEASSA